jgi:hypothetical protein
VQVRACVCGGVGATRCAASRPRHMCMPAAPPLNARTRPPPPPPPPPGARGGPAAAGGGESGTLTRTMKPRRPAIMTAYAREVGELLGRLRG